MSEQQAIHDAIIAILGLKIEKLENRVYSGKDSPEIDAKIAEIQTRLSPREQAQCISQGKDEPHHIGAKTREVLIQEIYSLINTKPAFRPQDYDAQVVSRWNELAELVGDIEADKSVMKLYEYIRQQNEHIASMLRGTQHGI